MFNKRGLGRIHRKENSFNQDQINLAPLLANQVSLIVQVNYIDLLKSWFHWKKATTLYMLWNNQSWFRQTSTPPPPPYYYSPTKKVFGFARISWVVPGGVGGGARAPPPPPAPPRGYATAWSPSYIHHINLLERVQRSFTKRIPGCSNLSYIERLSHLNLHTLEQRRLFADLIMCYNIVKGNNCIDPSTFFSFPNYKFSRGHPLKISIPLAKLNARKFFFASRVIPAWNSLPETTVLAPSSFSFKHHLHQTDFSKFLIFPPAIM